MAFFLLLCFFPSFFAPHCPFLPSSYFSISILRIFFSHQKLNHYHHSLIIKGRPGGQIIQISIMQPRPSVSLSPDFFPRHPSSRLFTILKIPTKKLFCRNTHSSILALPILQKFSSSFSNPHSVRRKALFIINSSSAKFLISRPTFPNQHHSRRMMTMTHLRKLLKMMMVVGCGCNPHLGFHMLQIYF